MSTKCIIGSVVLSFVFGYGCEALISEKKIFGGKSPRTMTGEWDKEREKMMQAWPRTVGPPVAMNPISRQNFVLKSPTSH